MCVVLEEVQELLGLLLGQRRAVPVAVDALVAEDIPQGYPSSFPETPMLAQLNFDVADRLLVVGIVSCELYDMLDAIALADYVVGWDWAGHYFVSLGGARYSVFSTASLRSL